MVSPDYISISEDLQIVCEKKCMSMVKKIMSECTHPLFHHVNVPTNTWTNTEQDLLQNKQVSLKFHTIGNQIVEVQY